MHSTRLVAPYGPLRGPVGPLSTEGMALLFPDSPGLRQLR